MNGVTTIGSYGNGSAVYRRLLDEALRITKIGGTILLAPFMYRVTNPRRDNMIYDEYGKKKGLTVNVETFQSPIHGSETRLRIVKK